MDSPRAVDTSGPCVRHGKRRLFHTVCHLKHDTQHDPRREPGDPVVAEDGTHGVDLQGNAECHGEEEGLAGHEDDQIPAPWAGEWLVTDATADELPEIIDKLPLDGQPPVER